MIKKTLYFGNPAYLSLCDAQLVIKLPEVENNDSLPEAMKRQSEVTKPIEDLGVVVLDNKRITITSGAMEALLENNCALITKHAGRTDASVVWQHYAKRALSRTAYRLLTTKETIVATNYPGENQ